jgi:hypothetical protein
MAGLFVLIPAAICAVMCSAVAHANDGSCGDRYSYARTFQARASALPSVLSDLARSPFFHLYRRGVELEINSRTIEAGKGYVVILHNGVFSIGDEYRNMQGKTNGTHDIFRADLGIAVPYGAQGRAYQLRGDGAIRFRADGSVDVSGYHSQTHSLATAEIISDALKRAAPGVKTNLTAGRLSDLPK